MQHVPALNLTVLQQAGEDQAPPHQRKASNVYGAAGPPQQSPRLWKFAPARGAPAGATNVLPHEAVSPLLLCTCTLCCSHCMVSTSQAASAEKRHQLQHHLLKVAVLTLYRPSDTVVISKTAHDSALIACSTKTHNTRPVPGLHERLELQFSNGLQILLNSLRRLLAVVPQTEHILSRWCGGPDGQRPSSPNAGPPSPNRDGPAAPGGLPHDGPG